MLAPILSRKRKSNPKGKKAILPEIGTIFEEAIKGDLRSHKIGYVGVIHPSQMITKEK